MRQSKPETYKNKGEYAVAIYVKRQQKREEVLEAIVERFRGMADEGEGFKVAVGKFMNNLKGDSLSFLRKTSRTMTCLTDEQIKSTLYNAEKRYNGHSVDRGWRYVDSEGYVWVKVDGRYVAEHRYVMERKLGRSLREGEEVHHKDLRRDNNEEDNLELWVTRHWKGARATDLKCPHCDMSYWDAVLEESRALLTPCSIDPSSESVGVTF